MLYAVITLAALLADTDPFIRTRSANLPLTKSDSRGLLLGSKVTEDRRTVMRFNAKAVNNREGVRKKHSTKRYCCHEHVSVRLEERRSACIQIPRESSFTSTTRYVE
jgi:hypothetical protein